MARFKGEPRAIGKKAIVIKSTGDPVVSSHWSKKTRFRADEKGVKPPDLRLRSLITVDASNFTARIQH